MNDKTSLKDFKMILRNLGYRTKTYTYNVSNLRFLEVLDKNKTFVCGSGANCYTSDDLIKHKEVFDLLKKYKNKVYDFKNKQEVSF